jgi:hypothetical protein
MKKLYKIDSLSVFGIILIYFFSTILNRMISFKNFKYMPLQGKMLEIMMFAIPAIIVIAIAYAVFYVLLRSTEVEFKKTVLINVSLGLFVLNILSMILFLILGHDLNIAIRIIISIIGNGITAGLNWMYLDISRSDKIKISIWSAIMCVWLIA